MRIPAFLGLLLSTTLAMAQDSAVLVLGTATPGGGFPVFGDAYAAALNAAEPKLRIETRNTKGSTENLPLLEGGRLDLGLVAGELASEALAKPGTQLRIVAPEAAEIRRILERQPALKAVTMPAGSYPGQEAAIDSVGSWSFVFARPGLPEEQGYLLARALHRAEGALAARLPQARETTAANTAAAAPRADLIHPGVLRYLREAGFAR